jgi:outer membrane receptor protein involved in Fe transport
MRFRMSAPLAGVSLLVAAGAANAQSQLATSSSASNDDSGLALQEIIVTARRKEESLEDVPQTVNALSADAVEKLNFLKFDDVAAAVPGLQLSAGSFGYDVAASVRGLTFDRQSQTNPTVALYINDAPIEAGMVFQSIFDLGQIEVLRGPQGTLHGESAPSGAITITTRKPDMDNFGVSADVTGQSSDRFAGPFQYNTQAAINIPIIKDMLAVRLAGLYDDNDFDDVHSLNNPAGPFSRTKGGRATVEFQPFDALTATVTYQRLDHDVRNYQAVLGPGSLGDASPGGCSIQGATGPIPIPCPPAGYNGPPIGGTSRLGVTDGADTFAQVNNFVIGQLDYRFAGQRLDYVGSYSTEDLDVNNPQDVGNLLPGGEFYQPQATTHRQETHEIRLNSEERLLGYFDYSAGLFYSKIFNHATLTQASSFLPGSFGTPLGLPDPTAFNPQFTLPVHIDAPGTDSERSAFVSGTAHVTDRTEVTAGARWIDYQNNDMTTLALLPSLVAAPIGLPPGVPCSVAGFTGTYPGTCTLPNAVSHVPEGVIQTLTNHVTHKPVIYSLSASQHFTDTLMAYVNTGTAWRPGPAAVGVTNGLNDPVLNSLIYVNPEYSHSYEIGMKDMFLDRRAFVNLAVYHQTFGNLILLAPPAPYLSYSSPGATPTLMANTQFTTNTKAVVNGVDLDGSFRVASHWTMSAAFSYANGHVQNAPIPCSPPGFDGASAGSFISAVAAAGQPGALVYKCNSNASTSRAPSWNATLQEEYVVPLGKRMDAYARGLLNYYPSNPNAVPGISISSYALANLYFGVRDPDGGWDVSIFAKNVTNRFVVLRRDETYATSPASSTFGSSGYYSTVAFTPPMQVGVNVRYALGSR